MIRIAKRYELTDTEWERIENLVPPAAKTGRPSKWPNRIMLNAMLWLARSGSAWEDLPERYPPHQSVCSCFCKWRDTGVLEAVFHALNADADLENLSIDSISVKAHPQSAGEKGAINSEYNQFIGTSRGGKNTKIHALVDALGNPVAVRYMTVKWQFLCLKQQIYKEVIFWLIVLMAQKKSAAILFRKKQIIRFRRNKIQKSRGLLIGGFIKSAIWLSAFFANSSSFAMLPPDTITGDFLPDVCLSGRECYFVKMTNFTDFSDTP